MQNLFLRTYSSLMLRWYQSNLKPFESPCYFCSLDDLLERFSLFRLIFQGTFFSWVVLFIYQFALEFINLGKYLRRWTSRTAPPSLSILALIVAKFNNRKWQTSFVKLDLLLLFSSQHFLFKPQQHKSLQLDSNLKFMFHFKRTT